MAKKSYPTSEVRSSSQECQAATATGAAERSYPRSEVRDGGREELSHAQRAMAARAQEGLEEIFHIQGQEGWQ